MANAATLACCLQAAPHLTRCSHCFLHRRLSTLLIKSCRTAAGSSAWDAVVTGSAVGKLMVVDRIDPDMLSGLTEDVVLLVRQADGDEEVTASGGRVKAVVLCHELPHLSHLGALVEPARRGGIIWGVK